MAPSLLVKNLVFLVVTEKPAIRTYSFEMSLLLFLCNGVVPVISVLVLNIRSNSSARKRIVDHLAFSYYCNILKHLKKLCR